MAKQYLNIQNISILKNIYKKHKKIRTAGGKPHALHPLQPKLLHRGADVAAELGVNIIVLIITNYVIRVITIVNVIIIIVIMIVFTTMLILR